MKKEIEATLDTIDSVATYILSVLPKNAIIFLEGNLASGKTTLMRHIAQKIDASFEVTSPTFSLQNCYSEHLFHYDLYRTQFDDIASLGLLEEFEKSGWHFVEWGNERLKEFLEGLGYNIWIINIQPLCDTKRLYTIEEICTN
ncbi:MAG: tRNA (adenosine(37)-N6)-threonylcarbamoyltransferase complex ATPase subunit type 1 TsaE [Campylobacterales bacterium]|nr:tRNA (adenosine(37)-N6)-threonylcarbamoyltransferase complex ATPase subunit type 1 TsaE [Campylobacterales bacterium]